MGKISCNKISKALTGDDSLRNHRLRCKGRAGDAVVSTNKNVFGIKKKREKMNAAKAVVIPSAGDLGGSLTNNLKEALFLEMLDDSSDSPSFT